MDKNKIPWLNGLKGLCCILIFLHHYCLTFFNATYYGAEVASKTVSGWDMKLSYSPCGVILNGNFGVCIFVMISAFLFAYKAMQKLRDGVSEDPFRVFVKRYLRLMLPVAFIGIFYFLLLKGLSAVGLNYTNTQPQLSFSQLLRHIFLFQWVQRDSSVLGPLWCMTTLFVGSLIAMFTAQFSTEKRSYMPFVYALSGVLAYYLDEYYLAVFLGITLADMLVYKRVEQWCGFLCKKGCSSRVILSGWFRYATGAVAILGGIFLGGYPSYAAPQNAVYVMLSKIPTAAMFVVVHSMGAALILAGLMILPKARLLSSRFFDFLGRISMGVYLWHTVVIVVIGYYFVDVFKAHMSYESAVLLTFWIVTAAIVLLSVLYHYTIEKWINKLLAHIR